jgi:hypothetical protein
VNNPAAVAEANPEIIAQMPVAANQDAAERVKILTVRLRAYLKSELETNGGSSAFLSWLRSEDGPSR